MAMNNENQENLKYKQKNHWSKTKVDDAIIKINREVYKRNRQAPIQIKMDDLAIFINDKITRRGIAKGLVFIQEDFNKSILDAEKNTIQALLSEDKKEQINLLEKTKKIMKINVWSDIRFLMINKAITPREITELIRRQLEIDKDIERWSESIKKAILAD